MYLKKVSSSQIIYHQVGQQSADQISKLHATIYMLSRFKVTRTQPLLTWFVTRFTSAPFKKKIDLEPWPQSCFLFALFIEYKGHAIQVLPRIKSYYARIKSILPFNNGIFIFNLSHGKQLLCKVHGQWKQMTSQFSVFQALLIRSPSIRLPSLSLSRFLISGRKASLSRFLAAPIGKQWPLF